MKRSSKTMKVEKVCYNCNVAKVGVERINETGNVMDGASTECVTCSRNAFGSIISGFFGPQEDHWQPIPKVKKSRGRRLPKSITMTEEEELQLQMEGQIENMEQANHDLMTILDRMHRYLEVRQKEKEKGIDQKGTEEVEPPPTAQEDSEG